MLNRYTLIIIATIVAVYFTSLVYILPKYSTLWFTLEFIILPIVYIVGYELLMEKQDKIYNKDINKINEESDKLGIEHEKIKKENKQLKKEIKKLKSSSSQSS